MVASLGLALYVLACTCYRSKTRYRTLAETLQDGVGPMIFSPLSELVYQREFL
jgi:hypothetical protein